MKGLRRLLSPFVLLVLLFLFSPKSPGATLNVATDLLLTRWSTEHGLPQSTVRDLCRSGDGYLWLGTRSGLVRFDGGRFFIFNHWNSPQLPGEEILTLLATGKRGIWVGTSAGLAFFDGITWSVPVFPLEDGTPLTVTGLVVGSDDAIWVGTSRGLFWLRGFKNATRVGNWPGNRAVACLGSASGSRVWAADKAGEIFLLGTRPYEGMMQLTRVPGRVHALEQWRNRVWIAATSGLFQVGVTGGEAEKVSLPDRTIPHCLFPDNEGGMWVGTGERGLIYLGPDGMPASSPPDLDSGSVLSLLLDGQKNLWVGTEVSGLVRLRRRAVHGLVEEAGPVTAITTTEKRAAWVATRNNDIFIVEWNGRHHAGAKEINVPGLSLGFQDDDTLWVGTAGSGLLRLALSTGDRRWFLKDPAVSIRAILAQPRGAVRVATNVGLFRGEGSRFAPVRLPGDVAKQGAISTLVANEAGELWVGGEDGVWHLAAGTWTRLEGRDQQPEPSRVSAMFRDNHGLLWVGTRGWGLFAYSQGRWTQINESHGLTDNYVMGILQDDHGYLWCGSRRGVFRIMEKNTRRLLQRETPRVDCMVWNESEGMPSSECTADAQPSAWKMPDGRMLFATVRGVAMLDPLMAAEKPPPIPVLIEAVLADSRNLNPEQPARFNRRLQMLEFYFTYPDLAAAEKVVFRYRLKGFGDQWTVSRPGQERTALYLNLGPGKYEFQIQARSGSGFWTASMDTFSLEVRSRIRGVYLLLVFLLIGAAVGLWYRRHLTRSTAKAKYRTSGLTTDVAEKKLADLLRLMKEEKPFLEANLTLVKLARHMNIHANYLSRIINERRNQSFNDFVNQYRIEEACRRLADPRWKEMTILQIAYETGFYSKSVFNTAFKKFTGRTPSQYRSQSTSAD
ncbi:MAG TPA: helix-turn-helix domain-containing protein [Candidatus Aminicenantes bacterium]|nr:helix-turn-helix domain-containing protein [Candidatus Aminicenantes bacterium]